MLYSWVDKRGVGILSRNVLLVGLFLVFLAEQPVNAQSLESSLEKIVQQYNRPINPDQYLIRPGEELRLSFLGSQISDLVLTVDAEGRIVHREIGLHTVAGLTLAQLRKMLETELTRLYPNSRVEISVGAPRLVAIQVSGWVKNPGTYTGYTSQTVSDIIDSAGGLAEQASHRGITFRGGDRVVPVDLEKSTYSGDNQSNPNLYAGYSIFVPKMLENVVSVVGHVRVSRDIELVEGDSLSGLIAMAGGSTADADISSIYLLRDSLRDIRLAGSLHGGDIIVVPGKPDDSQTVFIRGAIVNPGAIPFIGGLTIQSLLDASGGVTAKANERRITVFRRAVGDIMSPAPQKRYPISSSGLLSLPLNPGDSIVVPSQLGYVKVSGAVKRPGHYPFSINEVASHYILLAGGAVKGFKEPSLFLFDRVSELTLEIEDGAVVFDGDEIIVRNSSDSSEDK